MITSYTSAELTTQRNPYTVVSSANFSLAANSSGVRTPSVNTPASVVGSKVFENSSANIARIQGMVDLSDFNGTIRVFGWSQSKGYDSSTNLKLWFPTLLFSGSFSTGGTSFVFPVGGSNMWSFTTLTNTSGFALLYPGDSTVAGTLVIDPMGAQYLEVELSGNASRAGNILIGSL